MATVVKATFVLATFVHTRNISAVTDPMLTKCLWPNFLQALIFLIEIFYQNFVWPNFFGTLKFFGPKILWTQNFWTQNFVWTPIFLGQECFRHKHFLDSIFFYFKVELTLFYPSQEKQEQPLQKSTRMQCTIDLKLGTKLRPHPPSPGWSPIIPRLFIHHPIDSQPSISTRSVTLAQPSLFIFCMLLY